MIGLLGPSILAHLTQAMHWEADLPTRQFEVEPRTKNEINEYMARGQQKEAKGVVEFFNHVSLTFMHQILADKQIWLVPKESESSEFAPVEESLAAGSNLREEVLQWKAWQEVPDMNNFGMSLNWDEFGVSKFNGNYQKWLKAIFQKHQGEVIEIQTTGEWELVDGNPPLEIAFWHLQFAENREDRALLELVGSKGSHLAQRPNMPGLASVCEDLGYSSTKINPIVADYHKIHSLTTARLPVMWGFPGQHGQTYQRRTARVLTLPQVLMMAPDVVTFQAAYYWFNLQRKIVKQKKHPAVPKARQPKSHRDARRVAETRGANQEAHHLHNRF